MKLLGVIIVLLTLFLFPFFHQGMYSSHDGDNHIARFASYYQAFQDGHFPPRWAGNLNFGYGTPVLMFFYPLPGYLASMFHVIGLSFQDSFKLLLSISFLASFITFYLWAKTCFRKATAVLGALLYTFLPYHFLNLYVRGDIGEMLAYVFVPLVFWSIEKICKTKQTLFIFLGAVFYSLLVISHNGVSLMFSPVFLLYAIVRSGGKYALFKNALLILLGLSLSAFFWIPALIEGKYVNAHFFIGNMYQHHFPTMLQLVSSPWGFGSEVAKPGGLSPQIGLLYIIFVLVSCVLWFKSKKEKNFIGMWIMVFLAAVFIMLPVSSIVWNSLSILRLYEFPWRFVGLAGFAAVVLACFVIEKIKEKKSLIVICIVLIVTSLPLVQVKEYLQRDDSYYTSYTGSTYYHGEASPMWIAGDPASFAKQPIEIIGGEGEIKNLQKKTQSHTFTVDAKNLMTILDNTLYFPGWEVLVDEQEVPIQFQDPNNRGLITFQVPQGTHTVKVHFKESKIRVLANIISLGAIILVMVFFIKTLLYNKKVIHS